MQDGLGDALAAGAKKFPVVLLTYIILFITVCQEELLIMIYGNPSYDTVQSIKHSILLREWSRLGVFDPLKNVPYPDEEMTKAELVHMVELQKTVDSNRLEYIKAVDDQLFEVMSEFLDVFGVREDTAQIKQLVEEYDPIIEYLKSIYNRPRPFQAAGVYGIPLYPFLESRTAGSASYPSGHTLQALLFRHIYMKRHPELHKHLMDFVLDVKLTREQGGVHYPSDGLFSMKVFTHLKPWIDARTTIYSQGLDKLGGY